MKKQIVITVTALAALAVMPVLTSAQVIVETVTSGQQSVTSLGSSSGTLNLTGSQFNPALGVLNSVTLSLTADLSGTEVGGFRTGPPDNDSWPVEWNYSGNVSLLGMSSAWSGTGTTDVNPTAEFLPEYVSLNLSAPSDSIVLSSGLAQFVGSGSFDLIAALNTVASWGSTPNNANEYANFDPYAGATLTVTYDYTPAPVPEPATILSGALLLLPFGIGSVRALRRKLANA